MLSLHATGRARRHARGAAVMLLLFAAACGPKADDAGSPAADTATGAAVPDTMQAARGHDMAGMSMTGDPDRDFLRMMSDHHKGLIALAHESMVQGGRGTSQSQADARVLDAKQDRELEQMVRMLEASYQDPYEPKVTPPDQATIDSMLKYSGQNYATAFYRSVVAHHQRAVTMVDAYLPKAKRADVKAMAEQMKRDQRAEIKKLERKAGS